MRELRVEKVTVNMCVGEGGEKLSSAENLLEQLTGQVPTRRMAKSANPTFGTRKGMPISCMVTLRKENADKFLKLALEGVEKRLKRSSFDKKGNVAFGIREHIELPGQRYDPKVGILGMDVALTIERPGFRVKRRKVKKKKVSKRHEIKPEETIEFLKAKYGIEVED